AREDVAGVAVRRRVLQLGWSLRCGLRHWLLRCFWRTFSCLLFGAKKPRRLRVVTIGNCKLHLWGAHHECVWREHPNAEPGTAARSRRDRTRDGGTRHAEAVRMVRRLWAEQDGRVLRAARFLARTRIRRRVVGRRDRERASPFPS